MKILVPMQVLNPNKIDGMSLTFLLFETGAGENAMARPGIEPGSPLFHADALPLSYLTCYTLPLLSEICPKSHTNHCG